MSAKKVERKRKTRSSPSGTFSAEEKAAMRARAKELKAEAAKADGEKAVLDAIAEMPRPDRVIAGRIHELVMAAVPELTPKTWYGMPAYAKDGNVVCFFQGAEKFKARYATLGFNDAAKLDTGAMWPTSFALTKLTAAEEKKIVTLIKKAVR